jgi:hypothetical protein
MQKPQKLVISSYIFVILDFTTIRRGFMKSREESTGNPEDGEQIIRFE